MTSQNLHERADKMDLDSEYLCDPVLDAANDLACSVNNGGIYEQIDFLVEKYGEQYVSDLLEDLETDHS